jgi:hypothetical protein
MTTQPAESAASDREQPLVTTLLDAGVGDTVFVVKQNDRYRQREGLPRKASSEIVSRVGRKYAYIGEGHREEKFDRETGVSWHAPGTNARSNGYGFDVYVSEQAYNKEQSEKNEAKRLQNRLCDRLGGLHAFSPSVVQAIHAILDAEGLD